jgi:hypothetical protein
MSVSWTADIFGDWGIYVEKTYIGGIGQEVRSLLEVEELAGDRNGLRGQDVRCIACGRGFGQLLAPGVRSVHTIGVIPPDAVLLKRPKALVTFHHQGDAALKFWRVEEAGPVARPGCCPGKM